MSMFEVVNFTVYFCSCRTIYHIIIIYLLDRSIEIASAVGHLMKILLKFYDNKNIFEYLNVNTIVPLRYVSKKVTFQPSTIILTVVA